MSATGGPDPSYQSAQAVLNASLSKPSAARVYDWYLDGGHHWEVDRQFGEQVQQLLPDVKMYARENRNFLQRAVKHCAANGVEQFIDIGSGLPTAGNVHEVAEQLLPGRARVVYIDNEPIAHSYGKLILAESGDPQRHHALEADLLDERNLWQQVLATGVIDPAKPVAVLIVAVLHFVKDDVDPDMHLAYYRQLLPSGSFLVMSHFTSDDCDTPEEIEAHRRLEELYEHSTNPGQLRTRTEFARFFGDLPLVEPGITYTPEWRPDEETPAMTRPSRARILAGVARKP